MTDHTPHGAQQIVRALDLLQAHSQTFIPNRLSCRLGDPIVWSTVLDLIAEECRIDDDVVARAHFLLSRHHIRPAPLTGIADASSAMGAAL